MIEVTTPEMIDSFTKVNVADNEVPFDGKNYTFIEKAGDISYTLQVISNTFNVLALGGVIGDSIDVIFRDKFGNIVKEYLNHIPQNQRDVGYVLPPAPSTEIFDAIQVLDPDGTVDVTIRGQKTTLATLMTGLNVPAGFTNVVFQNTYIDYSAYEKDKYGDIVYADGARVNVFSGTVDVPINDYDITQRLMLSLGSRTVIMNGSDNNTDDNIYSSTRIIGRIRDYSLATKSKDRGIGTMAVYSFRIEQNV
jgi:hypothetical protein